MSALVILASLLRSGNLAPSLALLRLLMFLDTAFLDGDNVPPDFIIGPILDITFLAIAFLTAFLIVAMLFIL
jgi:hypothetical protein